jgi:L-seryl-tRNA(Ser) seleniumtransferase
MTAVPVDELARRAAAIADATDATSVATEAVPGAGSAPGATIPSYGVALAGDHLAALRAHDPPIIARTRDGATVLDLRAVEPSDDVVIVDAARGLAR